MYVLYNNPSDYPGKYVARRFLVGDPAFPDGIPDALPLAVTEFLEDARLAVPPGMYNIGRMDGDEQHIVEVWI